YDTEGQQRGEDDARESPREGVPARLDDVGAGRARGDERVAFAVDAELRRAGRDRRERRGAMRLHDDDAAVGERIEELRARHHCERGHTGRERAGARVRERHPLVRAALQVVDVEDGTGIASWHTWRSVATTIRPSVAARARGGSVVRANGPPRPRRSRTYRLPSSPAVRRMPSFVTVKSVCAPRPTSCPITRSS